MKFIFRPSRPSPAMVVALAALFVALSGSAYALTITNANIKNRSLTGTKFRANSIGGNAVKESALTRRSMAGRLFKLDSIGGNAVKESSLGPVAQAGGATHYAVVNELGQLVRGRGVAANGVSRSGTGTYLVVFDRDVTSCAYDATLADPSNGLPPLGQIGTARSAAIYGPLNGVQVRTANQAGEEANRPFHLVLSC